MDGWRNSVMDEWLVGLMPVCLDGWLDEWMDGWMNGWLDIWISVWKELCFVG
jgi:hypothetical protein